MTCCSSSVATSPDVDAGTGHSALGTGAAQVENHRVWHGRRATTTRVSSRGWSCDRSWTVDSRRMSCAFERSNPRVVRHDHRRQSTAQARHAATLRTARSTAPKTIRFGSVGPRSHLGLRYLAPRNPLRNGSGAGRLVDTHGPTNRAVLCPGTPRSNRAKEQKP